MIIQPNKNLNKEIFRIFGYAQENFKELVLDIIDRIEEDNPTEDYIRETIDCTIVYNYQEWLIVQEYHNSPKTINYDKTYEIFVEDMLDLIENLTK